MYEQRRLAPAQWLSRSRNRHDKIDSRERPAYRQRNLLLADGAAERPVLFVQIWKWDGTGGLRSIANSAVVIPFEVTDSGGSEVGFLLVLESV